MMSLNPLLLVGGVIGTVSVLLLIAYACVKDKKTAMGFERSMADGEILRRLFGYAKPYLRQFVVVGFLVLFSISYDIASPLIVGYIEELVVGDFELKSLYVSVAVYAGVLVFSMASTYLQAVILQRVGQRIISDLREDLFTHIESLFRLRTAGHVLYAHIEDGEVGNLHALALQQKLLDAAHHVGEDSLYGTRRERGVVRRHVVGKLVQLHHLLLHGIGKPLVVHIAIHVVDFSQNVLDHNAYRFKNMKP